MYFILKTFVQGKKVIISREEPVQIDGEFRIPEILAEPGSILRGVSTTNITTVDYCLNVITENQKGNIINNIHPYHTINQKLK